ncbi:TniB family NTP-binding protein [Marinimicrobium sp. C2-29]|uniref:TniB family NTP-binding protein n=1 Tax=Marinimicrobium sp. C2-29 TaxID=3139825 RepID=UPI003139D137
MSDFNPYDAIERMRSVTFEHKQFLLALEAFDQVYEMAARGYQKGFLLCGPPGVGKTKLAESMLSKHPPSKQEDREVHEVISISMPSNPTIVAVCKLILDQLGQVYGARDTEVQLKRRLETVLTSIKTRVLIVDEAQHLVEGGRILKSPKQVADWIKGLMDGANISIVLIGIPSAKALLLSNSQLNRRFSKRLNLKGFPADNEGEMKVFSRYLANILKASDYPMDISYVKYESHLRRMHYATDGRIDFMIKLLSEAVRLLVTKGETTLSDKVLEEAFLNEIWSDACPAQNPFNGSFRPVSLTAEGQPFYYEE